jgi:ABC-type antimicrobial peptide transport system ATPase subunit
MKFLALNFIFVDKTDLGVMKKITNQINIIIQENCVEVMEL